MQQMYDNGYRDIVNVDVSRCTGNINIRELMSQYSKALIDQMKQRHASRPGMEWLEMDVLDLKLEEEFDLVIDKGKVVRLLPFPHNR